MHLEDGIERIARSLGKPAVLLCDRGTLDGAAYIPKEMWDRLLRAKRLDPLRIREGRYDAVFHLVTAAMGAEAYYSLMNNVARTEAPEFAREVRGCIWVGGGVFGWGWVGWSPLFWRLMVVGVVDGGGGLVDNSTLLIASHPHTRRTHTKTKKQPGGPQDAGRVERAPQALRHRQLDGL